MNNKLQSVRGTHDHLPEDMYKYNNIITKAENISSTKNCGLTEKKYIVINVIKYEYICIAYCGDFEVFETLN
jgi:hypothetical protein